jgi:hypothetical protein
LVARQMFNTPLNAAKHDHDNKSNNFIQYKR